MLRITQTADGGSARLLRLEGALRGPWLVEVRRACGGGAGESGALRLDLSAVTFVDAAGAALLRDLLRRGVTIAACSNFVAEVLSGDQP